MSQLSAIVISAMVLPTIFLVGLLSVPGDSNEAELCCILAFMVGALCIDYVSVKAWKGKPDEGKQDADD